MTAQVSARPRTARDPLRLLETLSLEVASLPSPLPVAWHAVLADSPAVIVRARWAGRPDAPLDLLTAAAADRHPKVRSAAAGNPALPLAVALRVARTCAPYGPLMVATRPDCPDELAADLVAAVGTLSHRRFAWQRVLRARARGLAGKPLAVDVAVRVCSALDVDLPEEVVAQLDSAPPGAANAPVGEARQLQLLEEALAGATGPNAVLWALGPLRGTPGQIAAVRDWMAAQTDAHREEFEYAFTRLRFWCAPVPITSREEADELLPVLAGMGRHGTDPDRLAVVASAVAFRPTLVDLLAGNPAVERDEVRRMLTAIAPARLLQMISHSELTGDARTMAQSVLADAGVPARPVDVLGLVPLEAARHVAEVADALEPVLGTAAWPVLAELFSDRSRIPLAHLLVTAAAMSGTLAPPAALEAADRLPTHRPTLPHGSDAQPEAPF